MLWWILRDDELLIKIYCKWSILFFLFWFYWAANAVDWWLLPESLTGRKSGQHIIVVSRIKKKSTGPGVSATISTISSSRQCSRQYIYACELAAAPLFHPIITRRDRHTWDPLAVWRCFAAVCWLLLLVGWWSYRREKRKSLSAAMSAVVSAVESISTLHA